MKEIEVEGKNVTLAVEKGLSELGLRRDQVEVEVLQEAAPGFLGMGLKPARVRLREKIWGADEHAPEQPSTAHPHHEKHSRPEHAPRSNATKPYREHKPTTTHPSPSHYRSRDEQRPATTTRTRTTSVVNHQPPADTAKACAEAKGILEEILKLMRIAEPKLTMSWDSDQVRVRAEVATPDQETLVGKEGKNLESLQFLVTLILSRKMQCPVAVQVDVGEYWREKEDSVILQVHQAMEMVKRTAKPVRLKPMDACLRRLVHRTLANHPEIETTSEGEGPWRKVVLKPKKK